MVFLAETSEGFAGMAVAFTVIFIACGVGLLGALAYGAVISAKFLRRTYDDVPLWKSRWLALAKQVLGYLAWFFLGWQSYGALKITIAVYLLTFGIMSSAFPHTSRREAARNALYWLLWDFVTISLPLLLLIGLLTLLPAALRFAAGR